MASPRSSASDAASDAKPADALSEHVRKIKVAHDNTVRLARLFGEAKGSNSLKGGKLVLPDGKEISSNDIRHYSSEISTALSQIRRMISDEKKREKAARRARRTAPRAQAPTQFTSPLVNFFKAIDLGSGPNGKKLQDQPEMELFFKNGIGMLTFGVSLFNVWGNIHKLRHNSKETTLSTSERALIADALRALREKKVQSGNMEEVEKLDSGRIQNKDYMSILSHYRNKEADTAKLAPYADGVARMSQLTKDLNTKYGEQLKAARPKAEKVVRNKPSTPVRKSAPVAPVKAVASPVKASKLPAMPAAPAKAVASPSKGKKASK